MAYYEIDEFEDVVSSLTMLENAIVPGGLDKLDVKWAVIAAHSALQGACVCILTRTDGGGSLQSAQPGSRENHEEVWSYYLNYGSQKAMCEKAGIPLILPEPDYPNVRLAPLRELAGRLPHDLKFSVAKEGKWPADEETQDFTRISRWRNEFTHFPCQSWQIELEGMPRILLRVIDKVEEIAKFADYKNRNRFGETEIFEVIERLRVKLNAF